MCNYYELSEGEKHWTDRQEGHKAAWAKEKQDLNSEIMNDIDEVKEGSIVESRWWRQRTRNSRIKLYPRARIYSGICISRFQTRLRETADNVSVQTSTAKHQSLSSNFI